ncbi:putative amidoligase domain-containing protein [Cohnella sp. 56]|uniref:putative amidoligase domain-containing protein n=1 Tax=Cohnella sp. 56 TaxID=3113722 RepID=UPI0030E7C156
MGESAATSAGTAGRARDDAGALRFGDSSPAQGTVWVKGEGAAAGLLASAGCRRLPERGRPDASDVVICVGESGCGQMETSSRAAHLGASDAVAAAAAGRAGAWRWNASAAAIEALPRGELDRRLGREGLRSAIETGDAGGGTGWRLARGSAASGRQMNQYAVTVFGMEAPVIRPDPGEHIGARELARRLARASARALYALGLELGTVTWQVDRSGRRGVIVGLTPSIGGLDEAGSRRLASAVSAFAARWREEAGGGAAEARLGADPEFVMLTASGRIVPASRYFGRDEAAGCDSVVVRGVQRWPLAELRPRPSREPAVLAQRIRLLLQDAAGRTAGAGLRWRAGAAPVRGLPLGGHLHFSGVALTAQRLRALDNVLALPLRLLEPPGAGRRRPRYGALGDCRPKPHGGFEYRTPPSWLVSPRLALGTLSLAKLAAEHARELAACRPLDDDAQRDAYYDEGDPAPLRAAAAAVRAALEALPAYSRYRDAVAPLFDDIARGRVWDESVDIRRRWRIPE